MSAHHNSYDQRILPQRVGASAASHVTDIMQVPTTLAAKACEYDLAYIVLAPHTSLKLLGSILACTKCIKVADA